MMNRRDILKSTVAAAVSARIAVSRGMIWHGGAASGSVGATFDFYISTTGSDANPGTLASPWAISALYAGGKQSTFQGKRVGLLPGAYNVTGVTVVDYEHSVLETPYGSNSGIASFTGSISGTTLTVTAFSSGPAISVGMGLYPGAVAYGTYITALGTGTGGTGTYTVGVSQSVSSGSMTGAMPTYIGSSDSSGHYSARAATVNWTDNVGGGGIGGLDAGLIGPPPVANGTPGYITIDGLIINLGNTTGGHGFQLFVDGGGTLLPGDYQSTSATGPVGILVENCEIMNIQATDTGNNDAGVFFHGSNGAIIKNNYIHDMIKTNQILHCHAIEEYASRNNQYIYNTIARCQDGVESKGGGSATELAYNYITASQEIAILGFDGHTGSPNTPSGTYLIHHNVLDGNVGATQALLQQDQTRYSLDQNISYYQNTICDTRSVSTNLIGGNQTSGNGFKIDFYGNLFYTPNMSGSSSGRAGIANFTSGGIGILDYNGYDMGTFGMGIGATNYTSIGAWRTASGADANAITGSPGFTGIVVGNGPNQFKLPAGSSYLNASRVGGTSGGAPCNIGAWDGIVTQIGCDFAPATP